MRDQVQLNLHDEWNRLAVSWLDENPQQLWRSHSDRVNRRLIMRWMPSQCSSVLKTDLFDEAVAEGLFPVLAERSEIVHGIDISAAIVSAASRKYPSLRAVGTDIRQIPYPEESFDALVSLSSLDHFEVADDIAVGLKEFGRILRPGGTLIVTLDNPVNPIMQIRTRLPYEFLHKLGVMPYFCGPTLSPKLLCRKLESVGFDITDLTTIMHCPRFLAVGIANCLESLAGNKTQNVFLRGLARFEAFEKTPLRMATGYFTAVRCTKR